MNLTRWLGVAVLVAGVGAAVGLWYLFFRPSGPAPVALSSESPASGAVATLGPGTSAGPDGTLSGGIDGTWSIDASQGSFVGYRVQEQLAGIGGNIAVGQTTAVTGTLAISGTQVTDVSITADLTQLKSDDQRRDGQLQQRGLETDTFPTATFKLSQPIDLGSVPADGQTISVTATGELTLHGVTKTVDIPLQARLNGNTIEIVGSLAITFADYSITPPTSFIALSVADHGTMELHLFFTRA
jgi:polyisoprenoid-binding protein YceI